MFTRKFYNFLAIISVLFFYPCRCMKRTRTDTKATVEHGFDFRGKGFGDVCRRRVAAYLVGNLLCAGLNEPHEVRKARNISEAGLYAAVMDAVQEYHRGTGSDMEREQQKTIETFVNNLVVDIRCLYTWALTTTGDRTLGANATRVMTDDGTYLCGGKRFEKKFHPVFVDTLVFSKESFTELCFAYAESDARELLNVIRKTIRQYRY